jgi:predicted nuclease of predicted toxin-antitoxin system
VKFLVDAQLPRRLALWLQQRGHDVIHTLGVAKHEFIGLSRNRVIGHR